MTSYVLVLKYKKEKSGVSTLFSRESETPLHFVYWFVIQFLPAVRGCKAPRDLSRIQNALTFLSPLCRDTREAHKDMMGVTLKTDALLRASR